MEELVICLDSNLNCYKVCCRWFSSNIRISKYNSKNSRDSRRGFSSSNFKLCSLF